MERRENDGCPVLKLEPCCPNTGRIQLSVTVWAAVGEQFLWMTVNTQGKRFRHGPALLRAELTQAYTSVSTDSWFQPQWEESWQGIVCHLWLWCCGCYNIVASSGSMLENKAGDGGEGFGCHERGRLHQTCGLLWSSQAGFGQLGLLNGVFQCYGSQKTHT